MTPERRKNLQRLLSPRHLTVIGGRDAEIVAGECARIGFRGPIWAVNPRRGQLAGHPCFPRIEDLPEPPDAVFLAVPRPAAIETVERLRRIGAGGVVCYTAGFAETGEAGWQAERELVEAAGELALVGPNCYGVINYLDRVALWPFAHGDSATGYGAAIVTQSGMLSSDLIMNQRSVPFAYMISAGNQAVLGLEDYVEALAENPDVRAIGLHIEGLRDIPRFAEAAIAALRAGVPIVALKSGRSKIGAQLTVSHTGSLAGIDALYQALFERLGIVRVNTPAQLLETLKFLCVAGVPGGKRVAGFTCSGGGATFLADYAEEIGVEFPEPSAEAAGRLKAALPEIATVSNPLDYTTPIWGDAERVPPVFEAMFADRHDAAVLVQDYPLPGLDESKAHYLTDAGSFIAAARAAEIPAAICSTLPENIDQETRDFLVERGVAPLQGLREALDALSGAADYGLFRSDIVAADRFDSLTLDPQRPCDETLVTLDEWQGKNLLKQVGLPVPEGHLVTDDCLATAAAELGFPVALKAVHLGLPHKTERGAVALNLESRTEVEQAARRMRDGLHGQIEQAAPLCFLVERMVETPVAELLVGLRNDPIFGLPLTLASGGVFVELIEDAVTLLLPATRENLTQALRRLKIDRLLKGFRGRPPADREALLDALEALAAYAQENPDSIAEIEINPLFLLSDGVCAVDVLMRTTGEIPLTEGIGTKSRGEEDRNAGLDA